jgi:hypothetical protein
MYPICVRVDSMLSDLTAMSMNAMRSHVGIVAASCHTIDDARGAKPGRALLRVAFPRASRCDEVTAARNPPRRRLFPDAFVFVAALPK